MSSTESVEPFGKTRAEALGGAGGHLADRFLWLR